MNRLEIFKSSEDSFINVSVAQLDKTWNEFSAGGALIEHQPVAELASEEKAA